MTDKQPQLEAFSKLIGMLETAIFNGGTGGSNREFYTIPHPGIFIDPNLKDTPDSKDMLITSMLFDQCFSASLIYKPILSTISQTYSDILQQSALPNQELTPKQEIDLKKLEKKIEEIFDLYQKYKSRYDEVIGAIIKAREDNSPSSVLQQLEAKRVAALDEWKYRGKKADYEESLAKISYIRSISPKLHFANLKSRFDQQTSTSGNNSYQSTFLSPPIHEWNSLYAGWAKFKKTFKYSELNTYSKHTAWSGSANANFGIWKVGGGASGSSTEKYENSENVDIELEFEYLRVRILRPWLVSDLFNYRFWTYRKSFGHRLISDGYNPNENSPLGPQGLMPVLPTDFVIVKNVNISSIFSEAEKKFISEVISGSVSGGFGPFSCRGSYSTTTTKEEVKASFDQTTLRIANPQIIAFLGILLPKTPNPDTRLPWGDDADFGINDLRSTSNDYLKLAEAQNNIVNSIFNEGND